MCQIKTEKQANNRQINKTTAATTETCNEHDKVGEGGGVVCVCLFLFLFCFCCFFGTFAFGITNLEHLSNGIGSSATVSHLVNQS